MTDRLRILQIAPLFTPDGAYGGPTRVATNLATELMAMGHDVVLAGAASGYSTIPTHIGDVPAWLTPRRQLVPGVGFAGMWAPRLLARIRDRIDEFDVVHIHMSRDLVTLPVAKLAARAGVPYVIQTHGMIDRSDRPLAGPVDAVLTHPALDDAGTVLYLTGDEYDKLAEFHPGVKGQELGNGVPPAEEENEPPAGELPEVLFLARLHPRKRPEVFVDVADRLLALGVRARFAVVGPDGGQQAQIERQIARLGSAAITFDGAVSADNVAVRMARCSIYVLPAIDEPFGMTVLEAMSVGRPVIVTRSCGLAPAIEAAECGLVVDESRESLAAAIVDLIENPSVAADMGDRGRRVVAAEYSMRSVAARLEKIYVEVIDTAGDRRTGAEQS